MKVVSAETPTAKQKKCFKSANGMQPFWQWLEVLMLVNIILTGSETKWDFFMIAMSELYLIPPAPLFPPKS